MTMSVWAAMLLFAAGAGVELDVAPDQPVPFVYVDEPLVVEVRTDHAIDATLEAQIEGATLPQAIPYTLGPFSVPAGRMRWCLIDPFPKERGAYRLHLQLKTATETVEKSTEVCRIDRITADGAQPLPLPFCASLVHSNPQIFRALHAVGISEVRLDAALPDLDQQLDATVDAGFKVVLYIDTEKTPQSDDLAERVAAAHAANILRWEVMAHENYDALDTVVEAVRRAGSKAPIALCIDQPDALARWLSRPEAPSMRETVLLQDAPSREAVQAVHRIAERAGFENWTVHVSGRGVAQDQPPSGAAFLQHCFGNLAAGAEGIGFDAALACDTEPGEALAYLNGLAYRLLGTSYAGEVALCPGLRAPLFRTGAAWLLVLQPGDAKKEVHIPVGTAENLVLTDAMNNPLPLPEVKSGVLKLSLDGVVKDLTGADGAIAAQAARATVPALARQIAGNAEFQKQLPQAVLAAAAGIAAAPEKASTREHFFALVRSMPELERQWHVGELPRTAAVPAMAAIARLARAVAAIEELRGDPFLEPIQDTLARCKEFQSLYLTSSTGPQQDRERGDWIVSEVTRLMEEAEKLENGGLKVEATALATLAEWRARSLEYTAEVGPHGESAAALLIAPASAAQPPKEIPKQAKESGADKTDTDENAKNPSGETAPITDKEVVHTVKKGDTVESIAKEHKVALSNLLQWNHLKKKHPTLHLGQRIKVRKPGDTPKTDEPTKEKEAETEQTPAQADTVHVVKKGDTAESVARDHHVTVEDLLKWNNLKKNPLLQIDQKLVIAAPGKTDSPDLEPQKAPQKQEPPKEAKTEQPPAPASAETVHIVKAGDSPDSVAHDHKVDLDDLLRWNHLKKNPVLQIGQKLLVTAPEKTDKPKADAKKAPEKKKPPKAAKTPKTTEHTVANGQNADSIARKYGVDVDDLLKWNNLKKTSILRVGQKLTVRVPEKQADPPPKKRAK
jgi:LysM repeat protein